MLSAFGPFLLIFLNFIVIINALCHVSVSSEKYANEERRKKAIEETFSWMFLISTGFYAKLCDITDLFMQTSMVHIWIKDRK